MAVHSGNNSKFSKLLKSDRFEIECHQCGGKLSISIGEGEKKHDCPFCDESKISNSQSYKLHVESQVLRFPHSLKRGERTWHDRHIKDKRSWMRRKKMQQSFDRSFDFVMNRTGRIFALVLAGFVGLGVIVFALGSN
ncbi:MAG TPA: hypothetical protein EYG40_09375 [Verrucomicrobia bacterium]|nr:hypothetical protein [Verrucomicrobiales bacterium]HIL55233.1 hypothetical protein [Verrucomicrobiota bacterium]